VLPNITWSMVTLAVPMLCTRTVVAPYVTPHPSIAIFSTRGLGCGVEKSVPHEEHTLASGGSIAAPQVGQNFMEAFYREGGFKTFRGTRVEARLANALMQIIVESPASNKPPNLFTCSRWIV